MRHPSAAALLVVVSILAVRPVSPVIALRPFLGYRVKPTKKTTKFVKILGVHLTDGFEDGRFDLTAASDFLVATTDAGTGVAGRTHLRAYKLKAAKGSPKHVKQLGVPVADEIGTLLVVNTTKPALLLVPTTADPNAIPAPPDANDPLDHYKCYRVAIAKKTPKLPKGLRTTVRDPFTGLAKTFDVKSLRHLCLPVDEDGGGIATPALELACYVVAAAKGQPKHVPQPALQLSNQLGPLTIDTAKESELCVAAERPVPTPTPGGSAGGTVTPTRTGTPSTSATPTPHATDTPSDLASVAPPLGHGVVSIPAAATSFLYTGANPIQTGVAPGTIDPKRVAVLRGRVFTTAGAPVAAVVVTIHDHPELGSTQTRANGAYDIAVNGGGPLTLELQKDGLISAARRIDVPWQDFVVVSDIVMKTLDPQVAAITFGSNAPFQTAESSMQSDVDGVRHSLLLFPAGTTASLVFSDGSSQPASTLHIRSTEFTVGASGPAAMPAALPPLSGYTYCTELSADEAIAAGADTVAFNHPVILYAENFLHFPVGLAVPLGFFDRRHAVWVPEANGRIVKIVAVNGGLADVDTDGDGVADNGLAIDNAERQSLGAHYGAGTSLWRMPVDHFSPQDGNNNIDTTGDETPHEGEAEPDADEAIDDNCESGGSIIDCENQVLGESVPLVGVPYTLDYRSDRVPGQVAERTIRLIGATVPPTLASIDLHLAVAGRSFDQSFPASANQQSTFVWDYKDAYGRDLIGGQTLSVTVDYNYPAVYREPGPFPEAFNQTGGTTLGVNPSRQQIRLSDHFTTTIGEGLTDARTIGLGGWTLSVHHLYDPIARVLHVGGGSRRRAGSIARLLSTIDLPGKSVLFDITTGPDGAQYVALPHGDLIIRVAANGTQSIVAGTGNEGSGPDGPATASDLGDPTGVAVADDGSVYIAEQGNRRVRRVGLDGTITTIAGTAASGSTGDGGPASAASFTTAERIAVGVDGSIYVVDGGSRIRRITTDGKIATVAGTGVVGAIGDNGPATSAQLNCSSVSGAADGGFFIADFGNHRVRRVTPDGIIHTVVDYTNDLGTPVSVRPAPDGGLFIGVTYQTARTPEVDLLKTDGTLVTVAGGGPTPLADGVPATQVNLAELRAMALGPDGSVYLVRGGSDSHIVRISPALPGFDGEQFLIASPDGTELYVFDPDGRHQKTLDARTAAVVREFGYDADGRLASITEKTGGTDNVTTIEHDGGGNPTAIVGPFGQRTELTVDAHGFLASITDPANEAHELSSSADGLLQTFTNPRGKTSTYTYDAHGKLHVDADPLTDSQTLDRVVGANQFTVTRTTALNRVTTHAVTNLSGNVRQRSVTDPDGAVRTSTETIDAGTTHVTSSDGTRSDTTLGPDPRFGLQVALPASQVVTFPSNLATTVTRTRSAVLGTPGNPLSLQTLTDTRTESGHTSTTVYSASGGSSTTTSALGRTFTVVHDDFGRVTDVSVPGIEASHSTYDARGRLAAVVNGAGPNPPTTAFTYDAGGFPQTITDPLGRTVTFTFDAAGRLTQKTLPDTRVVGYGYDADGNLTSVTPPGRPATVYAYDDRDVLVSVTPPTVPGSGATTYSRDADRLLTGITRPGGRTVALTHDAAGRLATRTLATGAVTSDAVTFGYDPTTRRLATITGSDGIALSYGYDGTLLDHETWTGLVAGTVSRTYTSRLKTATETVAGTPAIAFGYDADGLLTSAGTLAITRDAANGVAAATALGVVNDARTRNGRGQLTAHAVQANANPLYSAAFTRDAIGRLSQKVETISGVATTLVYTYDGTGRLTDVTTDGSPTEHYTYDDNGNRIDATVRGTHVTASYDDQDRLLQYGTATYTYEGSGELASKTKGANVTTYDYDEGGRLQGVALPDGTDVTYVVDGRDRRIGKKVNGVLVQGFLYGGAVQPVAELDGAGAVVSRFVYAGGTAPAFFTRGGALHRIVVDQIGSVRLVVNATTGAVEQRLDYDSFGNVLSDTNPGIQPFGFGGGLYDRDTKLVQFGVRDYDAETGRWTAQDPIGIAGLDVNLYRYATDDPVNSADPTGFNNFVSDLIDESIQDPLDFYPGVVEGALDLVLLGGSAFIFPLNVLGPIPVALYLNDHPVLGTVESAFDTDLVNTQSKVFGFGRLLGGLICGGVAGEVGAGESAASEGLSETDSEVTQIVRNRLRPVRPFAPTKVETIPYEQGQEKVGQLIDAQFDVLPNGEPIE